MSHPDDAYADLHDAPSSGDTYQPGELTVAATRATSSTRATRTTDDDNQDHSPTAVDASDTGR